MPPRKKMVTRTLIGMGENHRSEPSADHISMHSKGAKSSGEAGHRETRGIMAAIEDLQRSQAAIWAEFQSLPKKMESAIYVDTRPPYPEEIAGKPYPASYTPFIFLKYDGITRNAREHIRRYVDALTTHAYDHELRLKEFSKSLEGRAFTWYTSLAPGSVLSWNDLATQFMKKFFALEENLTLSDLQYKKQRVFEGLLEYIRRFRDLSLLCHDPMDEERLVDVCIAGMLYVYWPYLENLQISSFTRLVEAARKTSMSVRKPLKGSTSQVVSAIRQLWRRKNKKVEVVVIEEPKKVAKRKKRDRGGIPLLFFVSTEELYNILEAWVKDGIVTLPECKHEPTEKEKRNPLYCRYHKRCDHHTMDCYALRNIFHDRVAKENLVIKVGKRVDPRMHRLEVTMTFFIGCEDPMEEEVENMASSSLAPPPLEDEEMITRIQQEDKIHSFLEGIGLRPMARREVAQVLTRMMERNHEVATVEISLMQVAYQEVKDSVTFSNKDLVNQVVDGDRPLYVIVFLGASRIKKALVDTVAFTNILPLLIFDALGIPRERIIPELMQVAGIEEEDDGEVVEPERLSKIRRVTGPNDRVIYEL
nr:hypothetical protein CFP56_01804 [Quercus suber]